MAGKIRTLGPGIFKITTNNGDKNFSADLTKAQLNPSNSSDDPTTYLDGSEETNTTTTWTFEGTVGDDFSEDGLAVWLFDHKGETLPAQFVPNTNSKIQWTFNVTVAPIAIGGDVKAKNTNDLSLAVTNVAHAPYTGK